MKTQKNRKRLAGIAAILTVPLCLTGVQSMSARALPSYDTLMFDMEDDSPMKIGECRAVRVYDPNGTQVRFVDVRQISDNLTYTCTPGDSRIYLTATGAGEGFVQAASDPIPLHGQTPFELTGDLTVTVTDEQFVPGQILGDADGSGVVDAADSAALLSDAAQYGASKTHILPEDALTMCDTNGDGSIDATDAANILDYAAAVGAMRTTYTFDRFMEERGTHFFGAYYSRIAAPVSLLDEPPVVCNTRKEMLAYFDDPDAPMHTHYGVNSSELDAILAHYTDDFFANRSLILIPQELGSGSEWFEVNGVTVDDENRYTVDISLFMPMVGTCDMAEWYLFVETDKDAADASAIAANIQTIHLTDEMEPPIS